jgi:hypothetical protein
MEKSAEIVKKWKSLKTAPPSPVLVVESRAASRFSPSSAVLEISK